MRVPSDLSELRRKGREGKGKNKSKLTFLCVGLGSCENTRRIVEAGGVAAILSAVRAQPFAGVKKQAHAAMQNMSSNAKMMGDADVAAAIVSAVRAHKALGGDPNTRHKPWCPQHGSRHLPCQCSRY